jgi:hypothetical protein
MALRPGGNIHSGDPRGGSISSAANGRASSQCEGAVSVRAMLARLSGADRAAGAGVSSRAAIAETFGAKAGRTSKWVICGARHGPCRRRTSTGAAPARAYTPRPQGGSVPPRISTDRPAIRRTSRVRPGRRGRRDGLDGGPNDVARLAATATLRADLIGSRGKLDAVADGARAAELRPEPVAPAVVGARGTDYCCGNVAAA